MENLNVKLKLLNSKGITIVSLVITITVMIIIIAVSINISKNSTDQTRLKGFYSELEIIQKRIDGIASTNETYYIENEDGAITTINLKTDGGKAVTSSQSTFLQNVLNEEGIEISPSEFRYFTISDIEEQLDLTNIEYDVFVHFDTRTVIAEKGITINRVKYYILKNDIYFVEKDNTNNSPSITLAYTIKEYGSEYYKIIVTPNTTADLSLNGILKYKKANTNYFETANGLEFIIGIDELTTYNVEYTNNNTTVSQTITVFNVDEEPGIRIEE